MNFSQNQFAKNGGMLPLGTLALLVAVALIANGFTDSRSAVADVAPVPTATPTPTPTPSPTPTPEQQLNDAEKLAIKEADDAIKAADTLIEDSKKLEAKAKEQTKVIKDTELVAADTVLTGTLRPLGNTLDVVIASKVGTALVTQIAKHAETAETPKKLTDAKAKLDKEINKTGVLAAVKPLLEVKSKAVGEKFTALTTEPKAKLETEKGLYGTELTNVRTRLGAMLGVITSKVEASLAGKDDVSLQKFAGDVKIIDDSYRLHKIVSADYGTVDKGFSKKLTDLLKEVGVTTTEDAVASSLTRLDAANNLQIPKLGEYYKTVQNYLLTRRNFVLDLSTRLADSRHLRAVSVPRSLTAASQSRADVNAAFAGVEAAETFARRIGMVTSLGTALKANAVQLDQLSIEIKAFEPALGSLQDLLDGDRSKWIGDQVTLYYFGDVGRLIRSINTNVKPVGGISEVRESARKARENLQKAELDIQDAQDEISKLQIRQRDLEAQLKDSETGLKRLTDLALGLTRANDRLKTRKDNAAKALTDAETAAGNDANNEAVKTARAKLKDLETDLLRDSEKLTDTNAELTEATTSNTALKDEKTGLPAQITTAKENLIIQQGKLRAARRQAILLAQADLEAFASARDNAPFLFGSANPHSSDPVERVEMFAYDDSKTLFLRGNPEDVGRAKDLIAMFDRPTPQARLTLWTLEMNGQVSGSRAERFNEAIERVEERLADTRTRLLTATSILRDCINEQVNTIALDELNKYPIYENGRLARYNFYSPEVVRRLGLSPDAPDVSYEQRSSFLRANLPDPSATTTFGEALMVLALARRPYQASIMEEFEARMKQEMPDILEKNKKRKLALFPKKSDIVHSSSTTTKEEQKELYPKSDIWFSSLRAALGLSSKDTTVISSDFALTERQLEILNALERVALQRIVNDFQRYEDRVGKLIQRNTPNENNLQIKFDLNDRTEFDQMSKMFLRDLKWVMQEHPELNFHVENFRALLDNVDKNLEDYKFAAEKARNALLEAAKAKVAADMAAATAKKAADDQKNAEDKLKSTEDEIKAINKAIAEAETYTANAYRASYDFNQNIGAVVGAIPSGPTENENFSIAREKIKSSLNTIQNRLNVENSQAVIQQEFNVINNNVETLLKSSTAPKAANLWNKLRKPSMKGIQRNVLESYNRRFDLINEQQEKKAQIQQLTLQVASLKFSSNQAKENAALKEGEKEADEKDAQIKAAEAKEEKRKADLARLQIEEVFSNYIPRIASRISPEATNARIAAADQMLKEIITAAEDDLDRHFVRPMLADLRRDVQDTKVNVGILNRTSILASNRRVARVDPSASAQLEMGRDTDIIEATRQLATIVTATQVPGVASVVNALDAKPTAETSKIYGVSSGAKFEVTPVIDPSGQALRFKFDYILQNGVREPDGTLDPQLPRVARHTVNTEVQLSNLEIRNISQFDANSKLGIPTKFTGGIPILNDIPYVKDIPLIGWFKKRQGKAAVVQQSVILAQTTIYPTIGDIAGLLSPTSARFVSSNNGTPKLDFPAPLPSTPFADD